MALTSAPLDWSKLPEDLLLLVLWRLSVPDILRSSAVCVTWSSAVRELCRQRRPLHQAPWLMLHRIVDGHAATKFYSLSEQRFYTIPLPYDPLSHHQIGCSNGWLIIADERSNLYLLNPIIGAQIRDLPPAATLDYVEAVYDERGLLEGYEIEKDTERASYEPDELRDFCYHKAVLSSSPSDEHYAIMVTAYTFSEIAFASAGDKRWTTIVSDTVYQDVAFHNDEFYLLTCTGLVRVLDLDGNQKASFLLSLQNQTLDYMNSGYVVPCPSEDLFQVRSEYINPKLFAVYRVNGLKGEKVDEFKSLGNYAFFVGYGNSMCLSCTEFPELRANCIYINQKVRGGLGIYDLQDGSFQCTLTVDQGLGWLPPAWIIPSLR